MRIIPVLDVFDGKAVHARAGNRASYAPLTSQLAPDAPGDAMAIARALRRRLAARELYLADLDAIMGGKPQRELRSEIVSAFAASPSVGSDVWVDAGVATIEGVREVAEDGATRIIIALESIPPRNDPSRTLRELAVAIGPISPRTRGGPEPGRRSDRRTAFSLDLQAGAPLTSHPALCELRPLAIAELAAECGMETIIALDLARVGMNSGPPIDLMRELRRALPGVELVAGGGVRDAADLQALADAGADAALVGSALHLGPVGQGSVLDLLAVSLLDVTSPSADEV